MNLKRNNINQIAGMFFITILVQFISLIRGSIVAYKFGISIELDALNFSMSTIGVLFSFISAGIGTILIPNLVKNKKEMMEKNRRKKKKKRKKEKQK